MVEIKRHFIQDGKKITIPNSNLKGLDGLKSSLTDNYCSTVKSVFENDNTFQSKGGMKQMGEALGRGVVLVMSIWDDFTSKMLWLDSDFPLEGDNTKPGIKRGPCSRDSGNPTDIRPKFGSATIKYSNLKVGPITNSSEETFL